MLGWSCTRGRWSFTRRSVARAALSAPRAALILGNHDPHVHVHVHIVPRYDPDPAPSLPVPTAAWEASRTLGDDEMREAVAALRNALSSQNP
jgi:diadenosine tetraphosphate (Ap4A) HIT family hydrolase